MAFTKVLCSDFYHQQWCAICVAWSHYDDTIWWASWHLKSLANWLFVQQLALAKEKNISKVSIPPVRLAIHQWLVDAPHKGLVIWKTFPCHDVITLQWRFNERDGISNHLYLDYLLNHLFRCRSKKTLKLSVIGLCERNSPVTDEFPAQKSSNAENVSIWWRHHDAIHNDYRASWNSPNLPKELILIPNSCGLPTALWQDYCSNLQNFTSHCKDFAVCHCVFSMLLHLLQCCMTMQ